MKNIFKACQNIKNLRDFHVFDSENQRKKFGLGSIIWQCKMFMKRLEM